MSLSLLPKDRVALVGQNGVGKSSLLKLLAGEPADSGLVETNKKTKIGFLKQNPQLDNDKTVVETVRFAIEEHLAEIALHQRLCDELAAMAAGPDKDQLVKKINALAHKIENQGGFDVDFWVERVLTRLGVKARAQKVGTLSGGERRRVDLARILLSAPDIYLLDEPTNHLDIEAISFLVETFKKSTSAVLFVSHDTRFVDELATRIIELADGKLYTHNPPFANYLENKLVRELIDTRSMHRRERLMVSELAWLRAGTPARTTKQNARIDRAYELINQVAKDQQSEHKKRLAMQMGESKRLGHTIIELDHINAQFGDRVLFRDFSLKVTKGQRYGILGPNGCGKTTLLSILAKKTSPSSGIVIYGKNTEVMEFDQQRQQLNQEATLKETLADHGDYVVIDNHNIHIASYLEKYLFDAGDANRKVSTLSGGEQNRLLLAKLFRHNANCLLLDEPTNDLDVTSLAVLEEVLLAYEGVIFVVSHDRKFLDRICTFIIAFEPLFNNESKCIVYPGNYSDYLYLKRLAESKIDSNKNEDTKKPNKPIEKPKIKKRRSYNEEREFQAMEGLIETLEKERADLHQNLADGSLFRTDPKAAEQKLKRLQIVEQEIERLYGRWQALSDLGA